MEWSKIKNIILIILLAVNAFLLVQVADQEWKSAQYRQEARDGAVEVLEAGGIHVDEAVLPEESGLTPLTMERSREAETAMAQALLGAEAAAADVGGGTVTYQSAKGEGRFRSDGSFAFTFTAPGVFREGEDSARHGVRLLEQAGYPCQAVDGSEGADGAQTVTVRQTWMGAPVFNCTAKLVYRDGCLLSIEGQRMVGTPVEAGGGKGMDVPTALLRFLAGVREGGFVCSEVHSLTAGYEVTVSPSGAAQAAPVWRVVTDSVTFYVDGTTGAVRQAG